MLWEHKGPIECMSETVRVGGWQRGGGKSRQGRRRGAGQHPCPPSQCPPLPYPTQLSACHKPCSMWGMAKGTGRHASRHSKALHPCLLHPPMAHLLKFSQLGDLGHGQAPNVFKAAFEQPVSTDPGPGALLHGAQHITCTHTCIGMHWQDPITTNFCAVCIGKTPITTKYSDIGKSLNTHRIEIQTLMILKIKIQDTRGEMANDWKQETVYMQNEIDRGMLRVCVTPLSFSDVFAVHRVCLVKSNQKCSPTRREQPYQIQYCFEQAHCQCHYTKL